MPRFTTSSMLLIWTLLLLIIGYVALLLRYHYRTADSITILQCTADTFNSELLRERQPIVCEDMGKTAIFSVLRGAEITPDIQAEVFGNLGHFAPRFGRPRPIKRIQLKCAQTSHTDNAISEEFARCVCQAESREKVAEQCSEHLK